MPDLSSLFTTALTLGRLAVVAYAAVATILTTACLTLQALTAFDRRFAGQTLAPRSLRRTASRPLFMEVETGAE
jgi:hypothetical protein